MGLSDNGGGGGPSPEVRYIEFLEKTRIPGLKKRIEIGVATTKIEGTNYTWKNEYLYSLTTQLLLLGKSLHSNFYSGNSPEAKKIAQKYMIGD